jgi:hypothetical protein
MNLDILGYSKLDDHEWQPIIQPRGRVYTQAFILCAHCTNVISSHGGPRYGSVCLTCYKNLGKSNENTQTNC